MASISVVARLYSDPEQSLEKHVIRSTRLYDVNEFS